jgi:hypothetical protein
VRASRLLQALVDRSDDEPWLLAAVAGLIWLGSIMIAVALVLLVAVVWSWMPWSLLVVPALVLMWWATRGRADD